MKMTILGLWFNSALLTLPIVKAMSKAHMGPEQTDRRHQFMSKADVELGDVTQVVTM